MATHPNNIRKLNKAQTSEICELIAKGMTVLDATRYVETTWGISIDNSTIGRWPEVKDAVKLRNELNRLDTTEELEKSRRAVLFALTDQLTATEHLIKKLERELKEQKSDDPRYFKTIAALDKVRKNHAAYLKEYRQVQIAALKAPPPPKELNPSKKDESSDLDKINNLLAGKPAVEEVDEDEPN